MANLSDIITPTNIVTAESTTTMTNKTLVAPALGTPASGVMTSVTGLPLTTGVTGTLPVANGGTGATALTANNVVLGNGTSAVQVVAPSTSGNVLTSNGTTWASSAPAAGGATSINGLSDGTNDGSSVGLGTNALANDDGTTNKSTALGTSSLTANTSGYRNTAIGFESLLSNTTGSNNTASGYKALSLNTTSSYNTAVGGFALRAQTTGNRNTASGYQSMFANTTGANNTAYGMNALRLNTTGNNNTTTGIYSLQENTTGGKNTAMGYKALTVNTTGNANTASGYHALLSNTTGLTNEAYGFEALRGNTTGAQNVGFGHNTLYTNTTSNYNSAFGAQALKNSTGTKNTGLGNACLFTNSTGTNNTGSGYGANGSSGTVSNQITLGDANIGSLRCEQTNISGLSDRRDKTNITNLPESAGLGIINALRPVTFNWDRREWYDNNTPDGSKIMLDWRRWKAHSGLRYGFIAQEVQATIAGEKCMSDSNIVSDENLDRLEFAPQHLLTNAIKAIQQLSTENEALKVRLTALENA